MYRTRIKICGLKRTEEVEHAGELGVDAIGLVFYPPSVRAIDVREAKTLLANCPPFVTVTGLFLDASSEEVDTVLDAVELDLLQFHGAESPDFCRQFGRPYIKAIAMAGVGPEAVQSHVEEQSRAYRDARGFLLDSNAAGEAGGSGKRFDWQHIPTLDRPLVLAGGIDCGNVQEAVREVKPYAVDVSSGVEVSRGVKSLELMSKFVQEVRIVDQQHQ